MATKKTKGKGGKETSPAPKKVARIHINKEVNPKFRPGSARDLYYKVLLEHNGKPVDDFMAAIAKNPPSFPKRGKLKGKPEPVQGWISYFTRNNFATIS